MDDIICDWGRGPSIRDTRITVYDVMDYTRHGWHPASIALLFGLSSTEVEAAIAYIEAHRAEVEKDYAAILARHRAYKMPAKARAAIRRGRARVAAIRRAAAKGRRAAAAARRLAG